MIKIMGMLQRLPDMPLDAFRLHWRTVHRGLALRLAHADILQAYVQNHRLAIDVDGMIPFADGVPELWFRDLAAFQGMHSSIAFRDGAFHDSDRFMDVTRYRSLMLEEEMTVTAPPREECAGLLKAIFILDDVTDEELTDGAPSPTMGEIKPVRLSYHRALSEGAALSGRPCKAVETSWWADLPTFLDAWSNRRKRQVEGILVEERPIFWVGERVPPADWAPVAISTRTDH
ncbi:hypothetical protein DM806_26610 [Sphingobium lactosutens]|uniref:EthD domain-containing protein n=1 Tax=Sphingobium lactosutens TaxID=522773 RepID=UPI0015BB5424|nr:EthD domain-containing protein [Sphingobium lactosutens]NWK99166.1 hypothetical protein [Sphingobium lactosutens]